MEGGERKSTLRSKRKPLSDCTNTRQNPKLIAQTLNKPPKKPSVFIPPTVNPNKKKNQNPNSNLNKKISNVNYSKNQVTTPNSVKSHTSTGSNNSPNFDCIPSQPPTPLSRSADIDCSKSRPSATQIQRQDEQTRKNVGKSVEATPIVEVSAYWPPRTVQISSPAVSRNDSQASGPSPFENHAVDEQRRMDKGKMVVEPIIQISPSLASHPLNTSSSASGPSPFENHAVDEQRRMDKGKMVVEPIIQISPSLASHPLQTSSSAASGNFDLPGPSTGHSQKQDTQAKKYYKKIVQEMANFEASVPTTPRSFTISSSAASGTDGQEKTGVIVYNQRRTSRRKKFEAESYTLPFSCPPEKRTKKKGVDLDDGGRDSCSGSRTDPLPLHKKKQPRNKKDNSMHAMPQDEVDKLKAYYADIDAFDLPEEVASESD